MCCINAVDYILSPFLEIFYRLICQLRFRISVSWYISTLISSHDINSRYSLLVFALVYFTFGPCPTLWTLATSFLCWHRGLFPLNSLFVWILPPHLSTKKRHSVSPLPFLIADSSHSISWYVLCIDMAWVGPAIRLHGMGWACHCILVWVGPTS